MSRLTKRRPEDLSADSVRVPAERSPADYGLHIAADHGGPARNHEVPRKKRFRTGTSSVPFPQRHRIKAKFISGKNISQIAREEARHWTTVKRIVEEKDVQEYVEDLRARFYGALEEMLFAAVRYARDGKDGGWLAYEMLKDSGVIPQRDGKHHPAMAAQEQVNSKPNSDQARIRMIATAMVEGALARQRFFAEPLPEMDATEEEVRPKR